MANGTTTLYVSDSSIRLMVTRGRRITKLADMPLEKARGEAEAGNKEEELAARIRDLFKRNHIGERKIILGISGLHCLTRPLVLPDLPRTMLDEAVTREARRVLPVPPEQLYISWQSLSASAGKMQAFMVAIPRSIADSYLKALARAGFKPYLMDIKPLALARLARVPTAVIVDVQPGEFDIVIMVAGMPQPIRTLSFPEELVSLKDRMETVRGELERTIQFYNSTNAEKSLQPGTPMLVSGELADEPAMYQSLAGSLGLQAALLASPLKCAKHLDPSHHLANVGLALKELTQEAGPQLTNFNTLPVPYQPKQISMNRILAAPMAAAAGLLILLVAMNIQGASANIDAVQVKLDSTNLVLEKKQTEKQELTQEITAAQAQVAAIEAKRQGFATVLKTLNVNGDLVNDDLNATVDNVIPELDLGSIGHAGESVSIRGKAASESEVMEYVRKLTDTGRFSELTIANINRVEATSENASDSMNFNLTLQLKEKQQ